MKVLTAEQMRDLDARAIRDYHIPGIALMENAGRGAVQAMLSHFGEAVGRRVTIFVGPGNNGGDGLVIARHLHQRGDRCRIMLLVEPEKLSGDAAVNLAITRKLPVEFHLAHSSEALQKAAKLLPGNDLIVDAIFGTGLKREVSGHFAEAIKIINEANLPVLAIDIPSGLDADSGQPLGICVQADLTATFGLAKPGLLIFPGAQFTGRLKIIDIAIPPEAVLAAGNTLELLEPQMMAPLIPARLPNSHKGTFGHLLILAGSTGKSGAAILCGKGALRAGTGLVSLGIPYDLQPIAASALPEAMTVPFSASGSFSGQDYEVIIQALAGKQALVIGPGLGTKPETADLVEKLYRQVTIPMVLDADALNILAKKPSLLPNPPAPRLFTPHPGEMARLLGVDNSRVQAARLETAAAFARANGIYLVLKGARSIIAAPDGRMVINPSGNPGMATGGMGDVLAGLLGGLLAQGLSPWQAACLGAYLHGLAGDRCAQKQGQSGYLASEVAAELPMVMQELRDLLDGSRPRVYD